MNPRYTAYLQETFGYDDTQISEVLQAMYTPLKKSIRINTARISVEMFKEKVQAQGWHLASTEIPEVWYVDRDDTTTPLGSTDEHQSGLFYIQEVSATYPPHRLKKLWNTGLTNNDSPDLILDMCSSPGGKTTQLAQYFPSSLIIANEPDIGRLPQLYENLDRMGHANICVTNYDGRYYQYFPEMFDMVLLDAPCSGEGCAYKTPETLNHWHIKNIRRIAKLQGQLFRTAVHTLKVGGILMYSTCTLNREENEGVIEKGIQKLSREFGMHVLQPLEYRRFWPHETGTGGFFYAGLRKTTSCNGCVKQAPRAHNNIHAIKRGKGGPDTSGYLYGFKNDRFICSHHLSGLMKSLYFSKVGCHLGNEKMPPYTCGHLDMHSPETMITSDCGEKLEYPNRHCPSRKIPMKRKSP